MKHQFLGLCVVFAAGACTEVAVDEPTNEPTIENVAATQHDPSPGDVAFANDVTDAMVDRLVALLFREFEVTTADNAAVGTAAISNIFDDGNHSMRLVGEVEPLQDNNRPEDAFERDALAAAMQGQNFSRTERVNGTWWVRKSIAVATTFSPSCVHCHDNFAALANPWVGALMVKAKVTD